MKIKILSFFLLNFFFINQNLLSKVIYYWERIFGDTYIMSSPCSIPAGIQCIDSNNCLIVLDCDGSYQKVLKSTDKGKSWIILSADSLSRSFFAMVMSYPSNNYIYVGATRTGQIDNKYFMQAVIWRTYDGGKLMMKHH